MAVHFYPLTVKSVERETPDCVTVTFDIPAHQRNVFRYKQGQNIAIKTIINGEEVRRSYSICKAPYEQTICVGIKKISGGVFSTFANEVLKAGDILEVMPPTGSFYTELNKHQQQQYLAIAAGSGITPLIAIIKQTLFEEPNSSFTLVYSNRHKSSILFFEELEAIKNQYLGRFQLIHLLSREKTDTPINHGRINAEKLQALSKLINFQQINAYFICGPEAMIFTVRDYLLQTGVAEKNIHFELFTSIGVAQTGSVENSENALSGKANITVHIDGRSLSFDLGSADASILDGALKQGADLPYACKGGMCCTCKAKLLEGKVKMDVHWGLDADEIENGFILTCQAHPLTENVVVDFDVR
ncbi:MAG: phenylacetate-CoA oxygenase/reductase subunit PaaK [Bacteroidota bacterium]|jgi:ring-1,2-phenylacetyl-CoA epoxidase subunit PaaE